MILPDDPALYRIGKTHQLHAVVFHYIACRNACPYFNDLCKRRIGQRDTVQLGFQVVVPLPDVKLLHADLGKLAVLFLLAAGIRSVCGLDRLAL